MKPNHLSFHLLAICVAMLSCVSSKKFDQANNEVKALQTKNSELTNQLTVLQTNLTTSDATNKKLSEEGIQMQKKMTTCMEAKESLGSELNAITKPIQEQQMALQKMEKKAEEGLTKFKEAGIDVDYVDGLVHFSLEDYLIFTGETSNVGWEGQQVLAVVGDVVNQYPGISIYVIGNTDDSPAGSGYKDNWSLSTTRANAVVRVLCDTYKVDPARVISGGRAQYHPSTEKPTAEGMTHDKRVDIYINPHQEKLWKNTQSLNEAKLSK